MEEDDDVAWVLDEADALHPTRGPSALGDVLRGLAQRRGWTERLRGAAVFGHWPELVGPELSRRCQPVRLVGGLLVIRAESTVWAAEIAYLVDDIVARANHLMGPGLVRDVRVVVGSAGDVTRPGSPRRP